jgi:S-DNA-T family DNA segregation ATPase FtsK/SpoIIIE
MATYQSRGRDPLLDQGTQAVLERRGVELLGLGLLVAGLLLAVLLGSYSKDDPNWMLASDGPVANWLGRPGAALAHPLHMIAGLAGWGATLVLAVWGLRLMTHRGEERLAGRLILSPLWLALVAVWLSTLAPGQGWTETFSFGLGGLFGDTVLGLMLTILPIGAGLAVNLWALLLAVPTLVFGAFVLGFSRSELRLGWHYLIAGLALAYEFALMALGRSARAGAAMGTRAAIIARDRVATAVEARRAARAEPPVATPSLATSPMMAAAPALTASRPAAIHRPGVVMPPEPPMTRAMPPAMPPAMPTAPAIPPRPVLAAPPRIPAAIAAAAAPAAQAPQGGWLLGLLRRNMPQAAPAEPAFAPSWSPDQPQDDRIRGRIADAIRARGALREEPPVTLPKGPRPLVLDPRPAPVMPPAAGRSLPPVPDLIEDEVADEILPEAIAPAPPAPRVVQPAPKKPAPSARAQAEAQPRLPLEARPDSWEYPPLALLTNPATIERHHLSDEALEENARMLESVLDDYGVKGEIVSVRPGPVVTMYELEPAPGLKASRVIGLADDIARSMSALSARVSTVPGRSVIGIELPNVKREKVVLREIIAARDFGDSQMRLPLALGKDIAGEPIVANLAKMPHLLIAGTTGSGKSVAINTMILSLLYKLTPEECRLIMIDPKMLELSVYDGIPHLLSPVVTDPKKAVVALKWVVGEMEERYRKMSKMGVRNIEGYNGRVRDALARGEMFSRTVQTGFDDDTGDPVFETDEFQPEVLPYIVVIVDEMADLMMVAGKEIEACIQRLAQMARASGIHLIMATQRPSVDVITGTIKANFPTRISFQVTSKIDSRTILGEMGAEQLLGMGDMLYMAGGGRITRIHGPFVSDEEVEEIVNHLKAMGPPVYFSGVVDGPSEDREDEIDQVLGLSGSGGGETDDALYDMAVQIVAKDRKCSTSYIQRKLAIGYNKAARLVEQMEEQGVVTPANHVGKREILVPEVH